MSQVPLMPALPPPTAAVAATPPPLPIINPAAAAAAVAAPSPTPPTPTPPPQQPQPPPQQQQQQQQQPPQQQQQQQQLPLVLTANPPPDADTVARFLVASKRNDEAAAFDFLRMVFSTIVSSLPAEVQALHPFAALPTTTTSPTPGGYGSPALPTLANASPAVVAAVALEQPPFVHDPIDQRQTTLVVLVPGRTHIVGHLIGKGGAEVSRVEREMGVTVKIETMEEGDAHASERMVTIIGTVAGATLAQQRVSQRVHEKLLSEGVQAEVLRIVVPNDFVRHLIGKSGSNINRLQLETGARVQVDPESEMPPNSSGRTVVIQGSEKARTHAQYVILRQLAEERGALGGPPASPGPVAASPALGGSGGGGGGGGAPYGYAPQPSSQPSMPPPPPQMPVGMGMVVGGGGARPPRRLDEYFMPASAQQQQQQQQQQAYAPRGGGSGAGGSWR